VRRSKLFLWMGSELLESDLHFFPQNVTRNLRSQRNRDEDLYCRKGSKGFGVIGKGVAVPLRSRSPRAE